MKSDVLSDVLKKDFVETRSMREAYGETLVELGKEYNKLVVLDADLSKSTGTNKFAAKFPERFFDVGVAEQNLIGISAGLALSGKIVFASSFAIFETGRAWEQIRNIVAHDNLNVKIVATHAGITIGEDGYSHQALEDISLMRVIPNMTVISPADAVETKKVIASIAKLKGPVYVRLCRSNTPVLFNENYEFAMGKAEILVDGEDAAIIATGVMVFEALKAAERLSEKNIKVKVINMSTIKPIDTKILMEASETKAIVTAEDHSIIGGLGSAVSEFLSENNPVQIKRIGTRDRFGQSGKPDALLKNYNMTQEDIENAVLGLINKNHKI